MTEHDESVTRVRDSLSKATSFADRVDLLPLGVGPSRAAIRAETAVEILGRTAWVRVPSASDLVPGVMAYRGRAVAVLDLGAALPDLSPLGSGPVRERVVVARSALGMLAIPVDHVHEVVSVPANEVREATLTRGTSFEVVIEDVPMPLVDLEGLLTARSLKMGDGT